MREAQRLVARADRRDADPVDSSTTRSRRPGMHVASLFCQHVHPDLPAVRPGRTWDDAREEVADLMIDTVDAVAPNFSASVLGATRADAARSRARVRAHRRRHLPRRAVARPAVLGAAGARARATIGSPVQGLYLCGAGHASRRRRDRDARPQRRARDPAGRAPPWLSRSRSPSLASTVTALGIAQIISWGSAVLHDRRARSCASRGKRCRRSHALRVLFGRPHRFGARGAGDRPLHRRARRPPAPFGGLDARRDRMRRARTGAGTDHAARRLGPRRYRDGSDALRSGVRDAA